MLISEGTDWFTNWADFPAIAANDHSILTSHLQKSANGTYTYDVMLNLLDKNLPSPQTSGANSKGVFTKQNFILHNDGTKSEHGFVSMLPSKTIAFLSLGSMVEIPLELSTTLMKATEWEVP